MSKTDDLCANLSRLSVNRYRIPDEFWTNMRSMGRCIVLLDRDKNPEQDVRVNGERMKLKQAADWAKERLMLHKETGSIIVGNDAGCNCCLRAWDSHDASITYKMVAPEQFAKSPYYFDLDPDYVSVVANTLVDWLKFLQDPEGMDARDVLETRNLEIRRYLITKMGYDVIKKRLHATVVERDKIMRAELFDIPISEEEASRSRVGWISHMRFVKVKDSSSDREYILAVDPTARTCRSAIAATFGLRESEYFPEEEA